MFIVSQVLNHSRSGNRCSPVRVVEDVLLGGKAALVALVGVARRFIVGWARHGIRHCARNTFIPKRA